MVAGGTVQASSLLGVPQSSISRRARSFANLSCLKISRKRQGYVISGGMDFFFELQAVARKYRYLNLASRWSIHPGLNGVGGFQSGNLPGQFYQLAEEFLGDSLSFGLIDQFLDAKFIPSCSPPLPLGLIQGEGFRMALVVKHGQDNQPPTLALGSLSKIQGLDSSLSLSGWSIVPDPTFSSETLSVELMPKLPVGSRSHGVDIGIIGYVEVFWKYSVGEEQVSHVERENRCLFEMLFFSRLNASFGIL